MRDRWRDAATRSLVFTQNGAVLAYGMIWTSRVHRTRYWTRVVVDPESRLQGVGRAVMSALADIRESRLPLTWRGDAGSTELAFADALGATTIQVVPPRTVLTVDAGLIGSGVGTVNGTSVGTDEVGQAWVDVYRWTHESWAPVHAEADTALLSDLEDDLDLEHSRFVHEGDGRISAGAFVFKSGSGWEICAETRTRHQHRGEQALASCIADALRSLASAGVQSVDFDGYVSDPHFLPVLSRLRPTGRWFRIVEWDADGRRGCG